MVRIRKPQYAGKTQLASFCKLFDIHIYSAHNYQLFSGHWGHFRNSYQGHFLPVHFSIVTELALIQRWIKNMFAFFIGDTQFNGIQGSSVDP